MLSRRSGVSMLWWEISTGSRFCNLKNCVQVLDCIIVRLRSYQMRFSDQFETRFAEMVTHYPTKRSALVPTLLYAQDEVGYLTDEVVAELAQRLDLTELEVRNVMSYYSMLTTKPRGKYNVQVCTNIACLLV